VLPSSFLPAITFLARLKATILPRDAAADEALFVDDSEEA
jgi:hypothetical protein